MLGWATIATRYPRQTWQWFRCGAALLAGFSLLF
jgi:hypothetical protein